MSGLGSKHLGLLPMLVITQGLATVVRERMWDMMSSCLSDSSLLSLDKGGGSRTLLSISVTHIRQQCLSQRKQLSLMLHQHKNTQHCHQVHASSTLAHVMKHCDVTTLTGNHMHGFGCYSSDNACFASSALFPSPTDIRYEFIIKRPVRSSTVLW